VVTPAGGNWYFGENAPATDSGGYWYFTNANATVSSTILGNVVAGGNSALTTNNANFTNYGDITGHVGLGTGATGDPGLSSLWFGGTVTVYNGVAGIIGGNVTVLSGSTVANPSGAQNFDNEGQILGNVLLSTAGSTLTATATSSFSTGCTTLTSTPDLTVTQVTGNSSSSLTLTNNGGPITAINGPGTTLVKGAFQIFANAGASLTNGGNIAGPVNVVDSVFNSWSSNTSADTTTFTTFGNLNFVTSSDNTTVTVTFSGHSASSDAFSNATNTSVWSAGTTAVLINTGTIGGGNVPMTNVLVSGDQSAAGNNSGFIYGNVTVTSFNSVGNGTTSHVGGSTFSDSESVSTTTVIPRPAISPLRRPAMLLPATAQTPLSLAVRTASTGSQRSVTWVVTPAW